MRAFVFDEYKQSLHEAEVPEPTVGDRDVLVRVTATSVNQLDERIRQGGFKAILPYKTPLILGHDVAGTVIRVGSRVRGFNAGDRVFARPRDHRIGTFAERISIDEADLAPLPGRLSPVEAASLPLVALTAWQALVERGNVKPGQKVLIHAGAGGVGTVAIQLAKHLGAHVATTVSGKGADFARELGADEVVDYRTQDFEAELSGYDFVLDSLGGENLAKSLRILKTGGKAVGIAGPPDPAFAKEKGLNPILRAAIAALSWKIRRQAKKLRVSYEFVWMHANGDQLRRIAALVDDGALRPVVGATFRFDQTPQALDALAKGGRRGKVGRKVGKAFVERLKERATDRDKPISTTAFRTQLKAIQKFGRSAPSDLSVITQPTLIANGDNDRMVPSALSADLHQRINGSELIIYPDSGHGGIFQYWEKFAPAAAKFLAA
ncbi:NADPH:quinone oxidoreductase [Streptomyces sp. PT12]|nr:NADPH:quinone oxidoreductase [Streptomyces sp. PT12]